MASVFSHYQQRGKCEWNAGLDEFIAHYNKRQETEYALSECLDVKRTGDRTEQQPEVLVTDGRTGQQMVVERKSVVWPPTFLLQYQNGHEFAKTIGQSTKGHFQDCCYELRVSGKELNKLDQGTVRRFASEIGNVIVQLDPSKIPIRRSAPLQWVFRRADQDESKDRRGIVVIHQDGLMLEDLHSEPAIAGTTTEMAKQLTQAAPKFFAYADARKVVLLDFYGDSLSEDDIPPLLPRISIPACIDEIWMTKRDWVSEDDYEIGFARIFVRSA
jgi:hypothetical protein